MANDVYTLIVVPHAKARFRRFQVPVKAMKWTVAVTAALTLAVSGILVHYASISVEVVELRRLQSENQRLRARTQEYEANAGKLQSRLEQLQSVVNKLGVMAGVETSLPENPIGGMGGPSAGSTASPLETGAMQAMDRGLADLNQRSTKLEEFYRDQKVLLASTPSIWPVRGYLSSGFGNRLDPFTSQRDFHPGIDISTPVGTRVMAPADGLVVSAGIKGAYGNALIIDHGFGIVTRYGHLAGFNVKPGQRVRRGDVVGFVGTTGRSTSPHLHYEVWVRDQNQNPIHYILDEYRSFG